MKHNAAISDCRHGVEIVFGDLTLEFFFDSFAEADKFAFSFRDLLNTSRGVIAKERDREEEEINTVCEGFSADVFVLEAETIQ